MNGSTGIFVCLLFLVSSCDEGGGGSARNRSAAAGPRGEAAAPEALGGDVPVMPSVPADAPVVVFLGDSVCAGLHLREDQAFPAVLARRLAQEGLSFRVVNACESGRTTAGARSALPWVLRSEPDVVVLEIGGNDGLRGIALEDVEANLRSLIEGSREAGARVLLLGVRLPTNYGEYGERFDALYPRLAQEYGVTFVPYFMEGVGGVPERNLPDGLHPTPEGQELLADNVAGALRAVLEAAR